jgi:hypothetical protein
MSVTDITTFEKLRTFKNFKKERLCNLFHVILDMIRIEHF